MRSGESVNVTSSRKQVKGMYTGCSVGMVVTNSRTQDKKFVTFNTQDIIKNKLFNPGKLLVTLNYPQFN